MNPILLIVYCMFYFQLDYRVPYYNYQELLKSESNVIDHGPQYAVKPPGTIYTLRYKNVNLPNTILL